MALDNAAALSLFWERVVEPSSVGTAGRTRPLGYVNAEARGARGDGKTDDTRALQEALWNGGRVWLASGRIYRIAHRLELGSGAALASDGSATLLLAAGPQGFDNRIALRSDAGIYGERGTGLRLRGRDITVSDLFIVKQYVDGRYVVGIDVRASSKVIIQRVRMRGFSLAPGIVTIRSSDDVEVSSSLIHSSCTRSMDIPEDIASFQITGISVDDTRVAGRDSSNLRLRNNVVTDLRMLPLTARGDQSDGINFAAMSAGSGSVIDNNDISEVDEGLDLFGNGIAVRGNRVAAHSLPLKLIHGARRIDVTDNVFIAGPNGRAVGIFGARPPEQRRQVQDILIERNRLELSASQKAGIFVEAAGEFPPERITLRDNQTVVSQCTQEAITCSAAQCTVEQNSKLAATDRRACKE